MTLTIGPFRITITITRLERFPVKVDQLQAAQEAAEIKSSEYFQQLKAQAAAIRASR